MKTARRVNRPLVGASCPTMLECIDDEERAREIEQVLERRFGRQDLRVIGPVRILCYRPRIR